MNLRLSSNMIGNCNDATTFSHKLILINRSVTIFCQEFANDLSKNIKSSKR